MMSIVDDIQYLLDEYGTPPAVKGRVETWIAAQRSGDTLDTDALRAEFVKMLTVDGSRDRRRKDFNVAIFNAEGGWAIWSRTDLASVMEAFDHAVAAMRREKGQ